MVFLAVVWMIRPLRNVVLTFKPILTVRWQIAEDDDSYEPMLYGPKKLNTITKDGQSIKLPHWKEKKVVEKILMTGWRRDIDDVIVLQEKE